MVSQLRVICLMSCLFWLVSCTAAPNEPTSIPPGPVITTVTNTPGPTAELPLVATPTAITVATATTAPPTASPPPPWFVTTSIDIDGAAVEPCATPSKTVLLFGDTEEAPPGQATFLRHSLSQHELCRLTLAGQPQTGQIIGAGGYLYYAVYDWEADSYTIWQDNGLGRSRPLPFTTTAVADQFSSYFRFLVTPNSQTLIWSLFEYEGGAEDTVRNRLWMSASDGRNIRLLLDEREDGGMSYYDPLRLTVDGQLLLAYQPLGLGGHWSSFNGRYQKIYQLDLVDLSQQLIFDCETLLCLADIAPDGRTLAYTDVTAGTINLITWEGEQIQAITPPGRNYLGYPTFAEDGRLFFTSADLDTNNKAAPGYLSLLMPPYTGPAEIFCQADDLTTVHQISGDHLLYWHNFSIARLDLRPPHAIWQHESGRFQAFLP